MTSPLLSIVHHLSGPSADVLSLETLSHWTKRDRWLLQSVHLGCNSSQQEPCASQTTAHGLDCFHHASTLRLSFFRQPAVDGLPIRWHPARTSRRLLGPCFKTGSKTTLHHTQQSNGADPSEAAETFQSPKSTCCCKSRLSNEHHSNATVPDWKSGWEQP